MTDMCEESTLTKLGLIDWGAYKEIERPKQHVMPEVGTAVTVNKRRGVAW